MKKVKRDMGFGWRLPLFLLVSVLLLFFYQYLLSVPFNIHSSAFLLELLIFILCLCACIDPKWLPKKEGIRFTKNLIIPLIVIALYLGMMVGGSPYTGGLHNYKNQSDITEIDFSIIPEFDKSQVQLVDKNTAEQLGDRVFGTLGSDEVSQYQVGDDWVQIAMNGVLKRVTPIDFDSLTKYLMTGSTPGYIVVDCETGEAELVRCEGLKYMTSAYLSHDLYRHLFFKDPFALFGTAKFELDDSGKPYWVVPVYEAKWVDKTRDVKGIYVVDPVSGAADYYDKDKAPVWVDNIYPVETIYRQFAQSKRYENGLFNFTKKGIVEFTDDYAYVLFDDNVHIYTGVTSVGKDESNVGFAYVNLRDGKISYVRRAGAEEYSARSSAEGALQQYHYSAIFPSMVNVLGKPTYFMGLVDGANLIKSYAFVSYENYQYVATGVTVEEAYRNYVELFGETISQGSASISEKTIVVKDVRSIVQNGNTLILILSQSDEICWYDMQDNDLRASFIKQGDVLKVQIDDNGHIRSFTAIN